MQIQLWENIRKEFFFRVDIIHLESNHVSWFDQTQSELVLLSGSRWGCTLRFVREPHTGWCGPQALDRAAREHAHLPGSEAMSEGQCAAAAPQVQALQMTAWKDTGPMRTTVRRLEGHRTHFICEVVTSGSCALPLSASKHLLILKNDVLFWFSGLF